MGFPPELCTSEHLAEGLASPCCAIVATVEGKEELRALYDELVDEDIEARTATNAVTYALDDEGDRNVESVSRMERKQAIGEYLVDHFRSFPEEIDVEYLALAAMIANDEMMSGLDWARDVAEAKNADVQETFHALSHMIQRNKLHSVMPVSLRGENDEETSPKEWLVAQLEEHVPEGQSKKEADNDLPCSDDVVDDPKAEFRLGIWEFLTDEDVSDEMIERLTAVGQHADVEPETTVPTEAERARDLLIGIIVCSRLANAIGDVEIASAGTPPKTVSEWETLVSCCVLHIILNWRCVLRSHDPEVDDEDLEDLVGRYGPNPRS